MNGVHESHDCPTIGEMAELTPLELLQLQQQAEEAFQKAKRFKTWVNGALALKYETREKSQRTLLSKETGVVRFDDAGVEIAVDRAKKLSWDQDKLREIARRITDSGDDPAEFLDISYSVPERRYTAWPESMRRVFTPARIFKTSAPSYKLSLAGGEQ